ncbi:MAG: hypothetical protein ACOC80_15390 [Petrotogales bacterium]
MNIFAFRWFILFVIVSLFGCATAWKVAENPAFQTTVQYAMIKFLSNDESKQSQAQVIIQKLQQYTDQSAQVTVDDLKQQVTDQVSWKRLDAADQYLLRKMIDDIAEYAQEQVGEGVLSGDDKVRLQEFLDWIEQAINFSGDQYTRINFNITQM